MSCELREKNMIPGKIYFKQANVWRRQSVNFATKNKFISNIYSLQYLGAPKAFGRYPRKHSWCIHFNI